MSWSNWENAPGTPPYNPPCSQSVIKTWPGSCGARRFGDDGPMFVGTPVKALAKWQRNAAAVRSLREVVAIVICRRVCGKVRGQGSKAPSNSTKQKSFTHDFFDRHCQSFAIDHRCAMQACAEGNSRRVRNPPRGFAPTLQPRRQRDCNGCLQRAVVSPDCGYRVFPLMRMHVDRCIV